MGHREAGLRSELHLVAGFEVPPFRHDAACAVDVAADQVLQEVVAVEPAPALPELDDPRPYLCCWGADGDGSGCREVGVRDEVIAGKRLAVFPVGCAPPQLPGPAKEDVDGHRTGSGRYAACNRLIRPSLAAAGSLRALSTVGRLPESS
jgi:hypothetical protein